MDGSRIVGRVDSGADTWSCSFFRLKKDMVDKFVHTYVFNQELVVNKRSQTRERVQGPQYDMYIKYSIPGKLHHYYAHFSPLHPLVRYKTCS